jgi:hypothetical protein
VTVEQLTFQGFTGSGVLGQEESWTSTVIIPSETLKVAYATNEPGCRMKRELFTLYNALAVFQFRRIELVAFSTDPC